MLLTIFLSAWLSYHLYCIFSPAGYMKGKPDNFQKLSVVIALRNEGPNLPRLIDKLTNLDYPPDDFEVIFVDDNSTDNTYNSVVQLTNEILHFKIIKAVNKVLPGKKGALSLGIEQSHFDFIVITDGDCLPGKNWLKSLSTVFVKGADFAFGITPLINHGTFAGKISSFENLRASMLTFGLAHAGLPYSAAARSFGFKKEAFLKLNGYSSTMDTLSGDDDLLLREAFSANMKIDLVTDPGSFVYSFTKENLKDYFIQKARHTTTSKYYLPRQKIALALWHLINLLILFTAPIALFNSLWLLPLILKMVFDSFMVLSFQRKFGHYFKKRETIIFQFIYEFFLIAHYFTSRSAKEIKWK